MDWYFVQSNDVSLQTAILVIAINRARPSSRPNTLNVCVAVIAESGFLASNINIKNMGTHNPSFKPLSVFIPSRIFSGTCVLASNPLLNAASVGVKIIASNAA